MAGLSDVVRLYGGGLPAANGACTRIAHTSLLVVAKLIYMGQMMLGFENWWLSPLPNLRNLPL